MVLEAMQSSTDPGAKDYINKLAKEQEDAADGLHNQVKTIDSKKLECLEAREENPKSEDSNEKCKEYR